MSGIYSYAQLSDEAVIEYALEGDGTVRASIRSARSFWREE